MDSVIDVVSNKVFLRMRNKTQLFSCLSDDHYHTRMMHSIEVAEITKKICVKLREKGIVIDEEKAYVGALLHDLGHTPFGHAGERALHDILKGEIDCFGKLSVVKDKKIFQGFKHNINSAYLYVSKFNKKADEIVLDCILKHTKLFNGKDRSLDYGKGLIEKRAKAIKKPFKSDLPLFMESFIVANADEIAQVYSDYLDCCENGIGVDEFKNTSIYVTAIGHNYKEKAAYAREKLIETFVSEIINNDCSFPLKDDSKFAKSIKIFSECRDKVFKKSTVGLFDKNKKTTIETLFAYFYEHPEKLEPKEMARIAGVFKHNCKLNKNIFKRLKFKDRKVNVKQFCNVVKFIKNDIEKNKVYAYDALKIFIREIAVYISMMTDNYAEHMCKKIISCSGYKDA